MNNNTQYQKSRLHLKYLVVSMVLLVFPNILMAQCANTNNIYTFIYNGNMYEVVKENKTWVDAASCANERGGQLAEINDQAEQTAVFNELSNNAGISTSNTTAPDGGGASYVWIGGNDFQTEGNWIWDGDGDSTGVQFWMGTSSGSPVGGLYNNWGNEPDDFGSGQDGLGLALTNWPLGSAGQWNDVSHTNTLYYLIEYVGVVGIDESQKTQINLYPNPCNDELTITGVEGDQVQILSSDGQLVLEFTVNESNKSIDVSALSPGVYLIRTVEGTVSSFVKND